ncbi:MAG: hypothetical protein JXD23_17005 [Spirochaetales bacterium]|nr:hypothetical protein [Spirochaetales bacterium]
MELNRLEKIIVGSFIDYLEANVLLGIKIGFYANIVCTIPVFIIGVPLSRAQIVRSLAEQIHNHHYNWFINLFRIKTAAQLKSRIEKATIIEMDTIMDTMIGPLLIAIEILGAFLGALIPFID